MTQIDTHHTQETCVSTTSLAHAKAIELAKHVIRMTTASASGHPSTAQALSHIVVELMYRRMRYDLKDPWNAANDRLVLSIGHAVPIVYAAYADLGGTVGKDAQHAKKLTIDDLAGLREQQSLLDGHPNPAEGFPFFDAATGSLGQGLSVGAGLALAARLDNIDKTIYVVAGDGEAREGQIWEAADFIVDHKLNNVCVIFSCNGHGQAAAVSPQQSPEALGAKMAAFGWRVVEVDGHNPDELAEALQTIGQDEKPTAIIARTVKGWGVESMLGKNYHGKPVTADSLDAFLAELDATAKSLNAGEVKGKLASPKAPEATCAKAASAPIRLPGFEEAVKRVGLEEALANGKLATRQAYGAALVALGDADERIVAVDGDVSNSTFSDYFASEFPDRFFECKIAEQNMITAASGLAAGGKIPFASTFAKFLARAVDQIDLATISRANVKIIGSHSGVSLGADGPSQMSISDVAYFRSMTRAQDGRGKPVCRVFHPSDAVCAYRCCELMANIEGLCFLRTHRPAGRFLYPFDERFELDGCKQLKKGSQLTIASSGYMVYTALEAAEQLASAGISCNVFDAYTFPLDATPILDAALSAGGTILTVEDNYIGGLHAELAEAAAIDAEVRVHGLTVNQLPKSAKSAAEVFNHVGVGVTHIVERARILVKD